MTRPEVDEGPVAAMLNGLPFMCGDCMQRDERAHDEQQAAHARDERARRAAHWRSAAGVPRELRRWTFDALDPAGIEDALDGARRWADGELGGLLLTGDFGVGKTTLAAAAIDATLHRRPALWVSATVLLARLGTGYRDEQREQAVEVLLGRQALVIDDIDKTRPTPYGAEQIYTAVDTCESIGRPLLVTTNMGLDELSRHWPAPFGGAIASRLVKLCEAHRLVGEDRRKALAGRA